MEQPDNSLLPAKTAEISDVFAKAFRGDDKMKMAEAFQRMLIEHTRMISDVCDIPEIKIELELLCASMESLCPASDN